MADETPQTEQAEPNPATEYQPPATTTRVYDADGREHFASATSKFIVDGLADGTLSTEPPAEIKEVPSGAETGSAGDDPEPGAGDGGDGSGDGTPEAGSTGGRRRGGKA